MAFDFGAEAVRAACPRHEFSSDDAARPRARVGPGLHLLTAQGQSLSSQAIHTHTGFRGVQGKCTVGFGRNTKGERSTEAPSGKRLGDRSALLAQVIYAECHQVADTGKSLLRADLGRKPVRKRMNRTLKKIKRELRRRWHDDVMDIGRWLGRVLRGWLNYYAVPTSFPYLQQFAWRLRRIWIRVLRRRSQKDRFSWDWLLAISNKLWPKLRIVHPWPTTRFVVNHRR